MGLCPSYDPENVGNKLLRIFSYYLPLDTAQHSRTILNFTKFHCLGITFFVSNYFLEFYIRDSVHRNSILIRSNKMQKYEGIYLLQNYSTCFRCPSHPSSGVHKTVNAASGTGHSTALSVIFLVLSDMTLH